MYKLISATLLLMAGCAADRTAAPEAPATLASSATAAMRLAANAQIQEDQAVRTAIKSGFHARVRDGEKVYCREESMVGTHFTNDICLTSTQLVKRYENQATVQDLLRQPFTCSGGFSCNGMGKAGH
jgi:hypothetical protein